MKKLVKSLILMSLVIAVPFSACLAQDSKAEKKVKVVINDGSGATVIVDTVFTNGPLPDSIVSKSGKVIYLNARKDGNEPGGKHKTVTVMMSSNGDKMDKEEKTIIVTDGEPAYTISSAGEGKGKVYAYSTTSDAPGEWVITKRDEKDGDKNFEKHIRMEVRGDKPEAENDMAKYVIARNGVVVTVECNDEAKARDIIKLLESKLGSDKPSPDAAKTDKKQDKK